MKCQSRIILRKCPTLRDSTILIEGISMYLTTGLDIVTKEWVEKFRKSKLTSKKRSITGEERMWKYFERYQEIFFNLFGHMFSYPSSTMTLAALVNFHNFPLSNGPMLWPKKRGKKPHPFGVNGWFSYVDDILIVYSINVVLLGIPLRSFLAAIFHRDGSATLLKKLCSYFKIVLNFIAALLSTKPFVKTRIGHLLKNPLRICWPPPHCWMMKTNLYCLRRWNH